MPHVTPLHADDPTRVGRYRLSGRIVGMPVAGPVYLARTVDGSEVTVTLLGGDWGRDSAARDRFTAEANAARRVAPFCAARILGAGFDGSDAFLVSEYVAGPSLREFVTEEGPWEGGDLQALAVGTATGLAAIHQAGLVHGQFGPEHVVLGADGPRVIEFGITPPYGAATPGADMRAWAFTVLYAAAGRARRPRGPGDAARTAARAGHPVPEVRARRPADRAIGRGRTPRRRQPARGRARGGVEARGARGGAAGASSPGRRAAAPASASAPGRDDTAPAGHDLVGGRDRGVPRGHRRGHPRRAEPERRAGGYGQARHDEPAFGHHDAIGPARGSPTPPPTVPPGLAGTWSGQVSQTNPSDVYHVVLTLVPGSAGGKVQYSGTSFSCSGELSLMSRLSSTLTLDQGIIQGQNKCADGVVTLVQGPANTLQFSFKGQAGPAATGTLDR